MSYLSKSIFIAILIFSVGLTSCKEEKKAPEKKVTTAKVVKKKETPKAKPAPKKEQKPVVKKAPNKYFLIVASFQEQANAERMQNKLKTDGYLAEVHKASNGFFRVSYKGFADRKLAFEELKNVRTTDEHKDTWLYIKR